MRGKYMLIGVIGIIVGMIVASAAVVLAGNLDPANPPATTSSYTLVDIYDRLDAGTAGSQSTWAEPAAGPGSTGYTLDDVMSKAPAVDDTNGAAAADVASGKTFWGLASGEWGLQTGTASGGDTYNASVPKTGQTSLLVTGDDGDLEKGVAWPNPRFTDNGNGTVTDNLTGLIWLKDANCNGRKQWTTAVSWANGLYDGCPSCGGTNGDCGLSDGSSAGDWRLPNARELASLIHYGFISPAVPNTLGTGQWTSGDPFNNIQYLDYNYWASTTRPSSTLRWCVAMVDGDINRDDYWNSYYVWPVRGGQ